jgi:exonuclease VII large subunit
MAFEEITGQKFTNGLEVLINVKVVYSPNYRLQLELYGIDPNFTLGNIEKQRRETLKALLTNNPDVIEMREEKYITRKNQKILNMGFAIIKQEGKYVTRKSEIKSGKEFDVVMKDGTIKAKY